MVAQDLDRGEEFTTTYELPMTDLLTLLAEERAQVYQAISTKLKFKSSVGTKAKRKLVVSGRVNLDGYDVFCPLHPWLSLLHRSPDSETISRGNELARTPFIVDGHPMTMALYSAHRIVTVVVSDRMQFMDAEIHFPALVLKHLARCQKKLNKKDAAEAKSPQISPATTSM